MTGITVLLLKLAEKLYCDIQQILVMAKKSKQPIILIFTVVVLPLKFNQAYMYFAAKWMSFDTFNPYKCDLQWAINSLHLVSN